MLLDTLFEISGEAIFLFCLALALLAIAGTWLYKSDTNSMRKAKPYIALVAFLLLAIFGRPVADYLSNLAFGVGDGVGANGNATGAAISAAQAVSGWVPIGTIMSKLFIAGLFFLFFVLVIWLTQRQTHPAPTDWAKHQYTTDFNELKNPLNKFSIYQNMRQHYIWLAMASIIGACLIQ